MYELLRRLAAVVDLGSVTAAAARLNLTQPAVTKSLQQLEAHYGTQLVFRTKRGMTPTEAGKTVYQLAKLMQKSVRDVEDEITARRADDERQLRIGAGLLWCYRYLPDALDRMREDMPKLAVEIVVKPPDELHEMVCKGDIDVGVGQIPKAKVSGVVYDELLASDSSFFCCRSHPLQSRPLVTSADLKAYPRISFTADEDEGLDYPDMGHQMEIKVNNLMLACLIMRGGRHIMRLPEPLAPVVSAIDVVPLASDATKFQFISGLFYYKSALLNKARNSFINIIKEIAAHSN